MVSSSATSTTVLGAQQTGKTNLLPINNKDGSIRKVDPPFLYHQQIIFLTEEQKGQMFFYQRDYTELSFPRDTCDTWREVNVPHGKQFNLFNQLTFLISSVSRVSTRIFLLST